MPLSLYGPSILVVGGQSRLRWEKCQKSRLRWKRWVNWFRSWSGKKKKMWLCRWRGSNSESVRVQLWGGATHVGSWVWWHRGLGSWERCPQWCDKEWPTEAAEVHPLLILKASQTSPKSHGNLEPGAPHSLSFHLLTASRNPPGQRTQNFHGSFEI